MSKNIELNFIWVGKNQMPQFQQLNLKQIIKSNINTAINIWYDNDQTKSGMQSWLDKYSIQVKFRNIDTLEYNENAKHIVIAAIDRNLWSCAGDILKTVILSRPKEYDQPSKRMYCEADNTMSPEFIKHLLSLQHGLFALIENRNTIPKEGDLDFTLDKDFLAMVLRKDHIRSDFLFIDIERGYAEQIRRNHSIIFNDHIINTAISKLFIHAKDNNGLNEQVILSSFGNLNPMIISMMIIDSAYNSTLINARYLGDIGDIERDTNYLLNLISKYIDTNDFVPGCKRSWMNHDMTEYDRIGVSLAFIITIRWAELSNNLIFAKYSILRFITKGYVEKEFVNEPPASHLEKLIQYQIAMHTHFKDYDFVLFLREIKNIIHSSHEYKNNIQDNICSMRASYTLS